MSQSSIENTTGIGIENGTAVKITMDYRNRSMYEIEEFILSTRAEPWAVIIMPLMYVLNSVVITLLCAYATLYWFTRRQRELSKDIPGFPTLPFVGNIHQLVGSTKEKFLRLKEWSELAITHNSMSKVWFGPNLVLVIVKPEDIKAVTNAYIEKPFFYNLGRPWLGEGLVTASGSVWKKNVKKLATTFTGSIIDGFQDVFNLQSMDLAKKLEGEIGKGPFNALDKYLALTTLETICQTALGISDISNDIVNSEYYKTFNRTLELMISRGFNVFLYPEFIYSLTAQGREFKRCLKILHHISKTAITKKKQEKSDEKKDTSHVTEENPRVKSFLDMLLELRKTDNGLTDEQIQAEVDTVIVGGQETTATALHHILIQLGKYPNVQKKLSEEFSEIIGSRDRPVTKEDLSKMRYCDAVINETLRLYPPVPVVMRHADRDIRLDGYTIPRGATCAISIWGAGRAACWGADADQFRPERWFDTSHLPPPSAFSPFSYGRRSCIGKRYAMALLKTILVHLLRRLRFESENDELEFKVDIALRTTSGHLVKVHSRD